MWEKEFHVLFIMTHKMLNWWQAWLMTNFLICRRVTRWNFLWMHHWIVLILKRWPRRRDKKDVVRERVNYARGWHPRGKSTKTTYPPRHHKGMSLISEQSKMLFKLLLLLFIWPQPIQVHQNRTVTMKWYHNKPIKIRLNTIIIQAKSTQ